VFRSCKQRATGSLAKQEHGMRVGIVVAMALDIRLMFLGVIV
jgi:hypothetical protein